MNFNHLSLPTTSRFEGEIALVELMQVDREICEEDI